VLFVNASHSISENHLYIYILIPFLMFATSEILKSMCVIFKRFRKYGEGSSKYLLPNYHLPLNRTNENGLASFEPELLNS
jgi:hypothetical protein